MNISFPKMSLMQGSLWLVPEPSIVLVEDELSAHNHRIDSRSGKGQGGQLDITQKDTTI